MAAGRRNRARRLRGEEAGQSLVEFAIVLPLFLVIVYGVLDFGIAVNYWMDENHLAASGARLAVVNYTPSSGTPADYIKSQAETEELRNGATVQITHPDGCDAGDPITVTVSYPYQWMSFLTDGSLVEAFGIDATTTIRGSATMRLEQTLSPCP